MAKIVTKNAQLAKYARPGSWNDPDMLEVGNGGMTPREYRSEISLWAEMAAPLIAGTKLPAASPRTLSIYENKAVIAIDQDPRGVQAKVVSSAHGLYSFAKPLASGAVAVALFNSTGATAHFGVSASQAGLPGGSSYRLTNVWSRGARSSGGRIGATVLPHATVLLDVRTAR
jgi:alpha-galactosidase